MWQLPSRFVLRAYVCQLIVPTPVWTVVYCLQLLTLCRYMHSLHHVHTDINWTTLRDFIFGNHIWRRGNRLVLWFLIHWKDPQWCVYIVNPVVKTICDEKPTYFNKHAAPPFSNNHFSTHPLLYIPTFVFTHPLLYLLNCVYTYFCIYSL